ncbi:MAG: sodium:proton antiporter [Spirochaetales bacterium]
MTWYLIGAIFLAGIWGIIAQRNLIKKIVGLSIANSAIIMFFIYFGSLSGTGAPIVGDEGLEMRPVDPVPQALMLTAIVVGICIVALGLVLVYRLYRRYGTLDMAEIERQVWKRDE